MDAPRRIADLPDELLSAIFVAADEEAVLACARVCAAWAALAASEELWAQHCLRRWPLLEKLGGAPGSRYPPPSWRQLHRSRVINAPPGTWRTLLSLYDQSKLTATQQEPGWIRSLGPLLLRVAGVSKLHGVSTWPKQTAPSTRLPCKPASEELEWLRHMNRALINRRAVRTLLAYAGDRHALEELRADDGGGDGSSELDAEIDRGGLMWWLDAWYDSGDPEEYLTFLAGRSTLEVLRVLLKHCEASPWVIEKDLPSATTFMVETFEACSRLDEAVRGLDAAIKSLHDEGCDMSVTSAQKTAHAALAPASHWWWKFEPPIFCSAGCPLIQPLRIS
tara:strand:+ start:89 stop:1093 length:1005 start_codon:yes stop_codon:yes gene_type:complete